MRLFLYRYRVLLLHLAFWAVYFSFYFYQIQHEYGWRQAVPWALVPLVGNGLLAYLNYGYPVYGLFLDYAHKLQLRCPC
jgi:hypothetical protein